MATTFYSDECLVAGAAADLAFIVAITGLLSNTMAIMSGPPVCIEFALALPVIATALVGVAVVVTIRQWIDHVGKPSSRLRYAAVVAVALVFTWSLNEWNLGGGSEGIRHLILAARAAAI